MKHVYVLIEDDLEALCTGEVFAIVKDKKTAKQFIKDYKADPDNYMCELHYEKWDIVDEY